MGGGRLPAQQPESAAPAGDAEHDRTKPWAVVNGVPVVRSRGRIITEAFVQRIMDEEGI
ncbi:MAG: hypothetical protein ACKVT1_06705 [Dehalococcoidia bacterium]